MPYIYKVENLVTGQFYYGARYAETVVPEEDLWINYFTSSKEVKHLIETIGLNSFSKEILEIHNDPDTCYQHEQIFIKDHINNPLCLNKQYTECGETIFLNKGHTIETKEKIRNTLRGRIPWNKGIPPSDETRKKLSEACKGVAGSKKGVKKGPRSEETRRKIAESLRKRNELLKLS